MYLASCRDFYICLSNVHKLKILKKEKKIPTDILLSANSLKYCKSKEARQKLISEYGWKIFGDKEDCENND